MLAVVVDKMGRQTNKIEKKTQNPATVVIRCLPIFCGVEQYAGFRCVLECGDGNLIAA